MTIVDEYEVRLTEAEFMSYWHDEPKLGAQVIAQAGAGEYADFFHDLFPAHGAEVQTKDGFSRVMARAVGALSPVWSLMSDGNGGFVAYNLARPSANG